MNSQIIPIDVQSDTMARFDHPVSIELSLDLSAIAGLRLLEVSTDNAVLDAQVPFQFETSAEAHKLIFLLKGVTPAGTIRHYHLLLDHEAVAVRHPSPLVSLTEVFHQGQPSYQVQTPAGTWLLHFHGAGFASLIDAEGKDWISYRPHGGSDGLYRGIPNIKNPDDYFHPGAFTGRSRILSQGAVCCRLHSETLNGVCEVIWELYPTHLAMKLLKAPEPYWFLYEGTPAGKLDEANGFIVRSDGTRTPAGESWDAVLDPGWLYFGSPDSKYVLFMAQHTTEPRLSSYFPMESNMTVFGFGRKDLNDYLTLLPATYYVGLIEGDDFTQVAARIEALRQPLTVTVGTPRQAP
jgi:hypothetical protein